MTRTAQSDLVEVAPPRRTTRKATWSSAQIAAAALKLVNNPGQWFSDEKGYQTRRQAYHKADALVRGIRSLSVDPELHLQRKTQLDPETSKFRWAIRQQPEGE